MELWRPNEMRKVRFKENKITWINVPCENIPAKYGELISTGK